jgi:S-methylmethionine transporter
LDVHYRGTLLPPPELPALGRRHRVAPVQRPAVPDLAIAAFVLCVISLIGIAFDPTQATALYFGVPFVAACYTYFHFKHGRGKKVLTNEKDPEAHKVDAP